MHCLVKSKVCVLKAPCDREEPDMESLQKLMIRICSLIPHWPLESDEENFSQMRVNYVTDLWSIAGKKDAKFCKRKTNTNNNASALVCACDG
jgi:hypothetical protein